MDSKLFIGLRPMCDDEPMPAETLPKTQICRHFGTCGGCHCPVVNPDGIFPLPYSEELAEKERRVHELLAAFDVEEWKPIVPAPEAWYYRNKMEFAFGRDKYANKDLVLGLRQSGRFDRLVDIETCQLMSPQSQELVTRVRRWAVEEGFTGYDRRAHVGDLRYLVVRETKNTNQRLAVLLADKTAATKLTDECLARFRAIAEPLVTTALLGITDVRSDVARSDKMRLLWGSGVLVEELRGVRFRISPYSFFQTNTHATEGLYGILAEWGASIRGALLDLYCGSGGITLSLARSFDRVIGVDTNREGIEDARRNAEENGFGNAEFVLDDALEFLKKLPASKFSVQLSAVIVDPPRPGLHPKALAALVELNPPRLAYVSCNPESLARDLQSLAPLYRIRSVQPVDLFPHTQHMETVVFLEHR